MSLCFPYGTPFPLRITDLMGALEPCPLSLLCFPDLPPCAGAFLTSLPVLALSWAADPAVLVIICTRGFRGRVSKSARVPQLGTCECGTTPTWPSLGCSLCASIILNSAFNPTVNLAACPLPNLFIDASRLFHLPL